VIDVGDLVLRDNCPVGYLTGTQGDGLRLIHEEQHERSEEQDCIHHEQDAVGRP
jgi:hypothetical protein